MGIYINKQINNGTMFASLSDTLKVSVGFSFRCLESPFWALLLTWWTELFDSLTRNVKNSHRESLAKGPLGTLGLCPYRPVGKNNIHYADTKLAPVLSSAALIQCLLSSLYEICISASRNECCLCTSSPQCPEFKEVSFWKWLCISVTDCVQ